MTDASALKVSVVCSTYQRAHKLERFIGGLESQTFPRDSFEVVIVNNGATDDTSATLARLVAASPIQIRVVELPRNVGAGGGRNAGWKEAVAPIVAFTDDDCVAEPKWLEAGVAKMAESGAAVVVGRTEPDPAQSGNSGAFSRTQRINERSGTRYFQTCNIFYRRDALDRVGGFDLGFRHKGGEDTDLGWRVLDTGGTVVFAEDALVHHDVSVGSFKSAYREASTWLDIPLVTRLHPKRARPMLVHRIFWKPTHERVLLAGAGVVVAVLVRNPLPLLGFVPWIRFRYRQWPVVKSPRYKRVGYLPHALVLDSVEVIAMVRGSIRHRTLVL